MLAGDSADLVVTDPPYNMKYEGAGKTPQERRKKNRILNDSMPADKFREFLSSVYSTMSYGMKDGASAYVFYKELGTGDFVRLISENGLVFKQTLVWVKNTIVMGGSKYQNQYEPCVFACKGKKPLYWYGARKQKSVIEDIDLMGEVELRAALKDLTQSIDTDVVRVDKNLKNDLHPTMKPIKLLAKLIKNSSPAGGTVLDLFGGSGSTMIACEQLGRHNYSIELDPHYCDVIVKRWEDFTGRKAELLNV